MSDYTKSVDFAAKDSLPTGNPAKIAKGTEVDTEFNNIATAIATKYDAGDTILAGSGTISAPSLAFSVEPGMGFWRDGAGITEWAQGGDSYFRLSSSVICFGTNSSTAAPQASGLKLLSINTGNNNRFSTTTYSNAAASHASIIDIGRSRGTIVGALTALTNGDDVGQINFWGVNTSPSWEPTGRIASVVSGTPGTGTCPSKLVFYTGDSVGSLTQCMTIMPSLNVLIGTTTDNANGGILQLNKGITFPATQVASTDANTLDDYEEGTWTPTLTFTTPGNLSVVYSGRVGNYTKIGRVVFFSYAISTSTFTHTTASGALNITGLPFTVVNQTGNTDSVLQEYQGITKTNYTQLALRPANNSTILEGVASGSGQTLADITATDMPTGGNIVLRGGGFYNVS